MEQSIKFIGHRGYINCLENSLDGIIYCFLKDGIDGVEIDVRMTKNKELVVVHNSSLNGITIGGHGKIIDQSLKELQKYDFKTSSIDRTLQIVSSLNSPHLLKPYLGMIGTTDKIATLEDVLKIYKLFPNKQLIIEIKAQDGEYTGMQQLAYEDAIVDKLSSLKGYNIAIHSYNMRALLRLKERLPEFQVGLLVNKNQQIPLNYREFDFLSLEWQLLKPQLIEELIKYNMAINSWDDKAAASHYKKINYIINQYNVEICFGILQLSIINDDPIQAKEKTLILR